MSTTATQTQTDSKQRLAGKVAVVTGGNSGIGRAIANEFRAAGAEVVILGRNAETLQATAAELGEDSLAVQGDVTKPEDLDRLFAEVKQRYGRIDTLVVNAGMGWFVPFADVDEAHFDKTMDVNVKGAFFTVQKALPLLSKGSSVVLTSSTVNRRGMANFSVYAAAKAAVRSFARSLSAELVPLGIRVNTLSPGPLETPIFERMGLSQEEQQGFADQITQSVPAGRFGTAEEMAKAALFLASDDSSYVIGHDLLADGGMSTI